MCGPLARAGRVWSLLSEAQKSRISPGSRLCPAYQRLPTGSARAVRIPLAVNIRAIGLAWRANSKLSQKVASSTAASTPRVSRQEAPRSKPQTV